MDVQLSTLSIFGQGSTLGGGSSQMSLYFRISEKVLSLMQAKIQR